MREAAMPKCLLTVEVKEHECRAYHRLTEVSGNQVYALKKLGF